MYLFYWLWISTLIFRDMFGYFGRTLYLMYTRNLYLVLWCSLIRKKTIRLDQREECWRFELDVVAPALVDTPSKWPYHYMSPLMCYRHPALWCNLRGSPPLRQRGNFISAAWVAKASAWRKSACHWCKPEWKAPGSRAQGQEFLCPRASPMLGEELSGGINKSSALLSGELGGKEGLHNGRHDLSRTGTASAL